jgi:hypothetical protein
MTASLAVASEIVLGGKDLDRGVGIITAADGGLIAVGVTTSSGAGGEDVYLVRLDDDDNVMWEKSIGGPGDDNGWAVLELSDGSLVIGGFTTSQGAGGLDCQLVKTDAKGDPLWTQTFGGVKDDRCWAVAATGDGGYVLAGETSSSGSGERDCYLVKTDGRGREIWSETYGGEQDDRCFAVTAAEDGGFVIAGQTFSFGAGDRDAWILKTDQDGVRQWSKTHGGDASDVAHSTAAAGDGSYLVTGYTTSMADTPDDPMVIRIADDGTVVWARVLAIDGHNRSLTGAATADGGACLTGMSLTRNPPTVSVLIVKINEAGEVLWTSEVASTSAGDSLGYGVTGTPDGGCAITGHTTVGSAGSLDLLIATVDAEGRPTPRHSEQE